MAVGHLSLPIYPWTFQNLRERLVKTQGLISPPFTCGDLPTHWTMTSNSVEIVQRTLTSAATKWYIEFPSTTFDIFWDLANVFLNHFQLPVRYDVGTDLLSTFQQDKATHILDHIQEWRRWKRLIKATIPPEFLLEWFLKSLLPYISKEFSTLGVTNE